MLDVFSAVALFGAADKAFSLTDDARYDGTCQLAASFAQVHDSGWADAVKFARVSSGLAPRHVRREEACVRSESTTDSSPDKRVHLPQVYIVA